MSDFIIPPPDLDFSTAKPPELEFAFRVRIFFKDVINFTPPTPMGGRTYAPPAAGDIVGPRLQGRVIPYSGADYPRGRVDGVGELNAHYLLEASDGTPIYINNRGYLYARDAQGRPRPHTEWDPDSQQGPSQLYFICTPVFDAPAGSHDWLTRHVFLCRGRRRREPMHTIFDYYVVTG